MSSIRSMLFLIVVVALASCAEGDTVSGGADLVPVGTDTPASPTFDVQAADSAADSDGGGAPDIGPTDTSDADVPIQPGEFGAPCGDNVDCFSGWCVPSSAGYVCSRVCSEQCPPGWSCLVVTTAGGDAVSICVPEADRLCNPCTSDLQCGDGVCAAFDDGNACTRPCGAESACPGGYVCESVLSVDGPNPSDQCVPESKRCDCNPALDGVERPCRNDNAEGTCWGVEVCSGTVGWGPCSASEPSAELCDGADNDCDGIADEEAAVPDEACEVTNEVGTCAGAWSCRGPDGWVCQAAEPLAESCNLLDDDCDGAVDEDFRDADGFYASVEHCGVCGQSCLGLFPHGEAGCVLGADDSARCAVLGCEPGYYRAGPSACLPVVDTGCQPCAADGDCQVPGNLCMTSDEGAFCARSCSAGNPYGAPAGECPSGYACDGSVCVPSSGSCSCIADGHAGKERLCAVGGDAGTCLGVQVCDLTDGWSGCSANEAASETCNGVDDDCDGLVDEGILEPVEVCALSNDAGTCAGAWSCQGSAGWSCDAREPSEEVCNYFDDDCDGTIDEGFVDDAGRYVGASDCGFCGAACEGVVPFATGTDCAVESDAAVCVATGCEPGYQTPAETARFCVQPGGGTLCGPCTDDVHCQGLPDGLCEVFDGVGGCTHACVTDEDCAEGIGCVEGRCAPTSGSCSCLPGNALALRPCAAASQVGVCIGTQACDPASGWSECTAAAPADEVCNGFDDDCDGLVDEELTPNPEGCSHSNAAGICVGNLVCAGEVGWVCLGPVPAPESCNLVDDDCDGDADEDFRNADGLYVDDAHCGICGKSCAGAIPNATAACVVGAAGPSCEVVSCAPGFYQAGPVTCLPPVGVACAPCQGDGDCPTPGDRCIAVGGGFYCGRDCAEGNFHGTPEGECPGGFSCTELGGLGVQQCVPDSGSCSCLSGDQGKSRPCFEQNGQGTCFGTQVCAPDVGWSDCTAASPLAEICNGADDDCDGIVDDVPGRGEACDLTNTFGVCPGLRDCDLAGAGLVCAGLAPSAESCNGRDDDCDGDTDEGFLVGGVYASDAHCGECGRSCVGTVPNGTASCDVSGPEPVCRVSSCAPGFVASGLDQCLPANLGQCAPCSGPGSCLLPGAVCTELPDGPFCLNPCTDTSNCSEGMACVGSLCTPETGSCICDGSNTNLQRGCSVDFVPEGGGAGYPCFGLQQCTEVGWTECALPLETCNLLDDDCDGLTDEGFLDASLRYTADKHCGGCGNDCTLLDFAGASGACNSFVDPPICSISCNDGCSDLNANPSDGCECCDPQPLDYPDPEGIDANCDGVDGQVELAVFVSKSGDDSFPGTRFAPKSTLRAGIETAAAEGKRDVYVSTGVYAEAVSLVDGVAVYGGYSPTFSQRKPAVHEVAILAPQPTAEQPGAVNAIGIQGSVGAVFDGFSVFGAQEKTPGASSYALYLRDCDGSLRVSNNRIFGGGGGKGARGDDGADGDDGLPGEVGVDALDLLDAYGVLEHDCTPADHSAGGDPGVSTCGADEVDVSGGAGGERICPKLAPDTGDPVGPTPSEMGEPGANGSASGGTAGFDVFHQAFQCLGFATFGDVEGEPGQDGPAGSAGSAGAGCDATSGTVAIGFWVPAAGASGASGQHAGGAGGGGSGGGAWAHTSCFSKGFGYDNLGGSGGGGGSGGCGGTAGTGGTGGGGAFGAFVVWSTPPSTVPDLHANHLFGGVGGDGGDGGNGGTGGAGGTGGLGGEGGGDFDPPDPTYPAFQGGKGGKGGNGGHAGGGGGGCGGPAFGLFAAGAAGLDLTGWLDANQFDVIGSGGAGGMGGFSLGAPGGAGSPGAALQTNISPP